MSGRIFTFLFLVHILVIYHVMTFVLLFRGGTTFVVFWSKLLLLILLVPLTYISGFTLLYYKKGEGVIQNIIGAIKVIIARNKDMIFALFAFFSLSYANIFLGAYIKYKNGLLYRSELTLFLLAISVLTLFLLAILYGRKKKGVKERVKDLFNIVTCLGKKAFCVYLCMIVVQTNLLLAFILIKYLCTIFNVSLAFEI